MSFVLDNSVSMRWFFEDGSPSDLAYADKILAEIKLSSCIVPATWGLEVANVLIRAEARSQVTPPQSETFVAMLQGMDIETDAETYQHALSDTLRLARTYKLSAYDASYLELALRLRIPLATLDESLVNATKKAGVKMVLN